MTQPTPTDEQIIAAAQQADLCFVECWALIYTAEDKEEDESFAAGRPQMQEILYYSQAQREERMAKLRKFAQLLINLNTD